MATTQIKNGFHGGTDDQLLVNPDGSINVNTSGGGGTANTNLIEVNGQPIALGQTTMADSLPVVIASDQSPINVITSTGFSTLSPGYPTQVSVGTSSVLLFAANPARKYAHVSNNSGVAIFIQYGVAAALNQGVKIGPGGFFTLEVDNLWRGDVNAIGLMAAQFIDVLEGI